MVRPDKPRRVQGRPCCHGFKPIGVPGHELRRVELQLDELEVLRLVDVEGMYQDAAAEALGVSRATVGRLLERARHKVARALIAGELLVVEGGRCHVDPQAPRVSCAGRRRRRWHQCHGGRHAEERGPGAGNESMPRRPSSNQENEDERAE
jgi:predicted DNA-binding protein (UPF0251 family)